MRIFSWRTRNVVAAAVARSAAARLIVALSISAAGPALAQLAPIQPPHPTADAAEAAVVTNEGAEYSLTIYSTTDPMGVVPRSIFGQNSAYDPLPGYGVVRDTRSIDLKAGENTIKFSDVASGIDATTVSFRSLTAPEGTNVLEQNYEYDLVSPDKLLQKYIGKAVIINRKVSNADHAQPQVETLQGTLLSYDADMFVLQTGNKQLPVQMIPRANGIAEIKLFDLQTGLVTKPTLVWKIAAKEAGANKAQVTYQTAGITWRADYNMILNKDNTAVEVGAWVSILNESGAAYPNCKLKLVAGDVHRLVARQIVGNNASGLASAWQDERGFQEKPFFEYHLYTLGRATSLANNSTKQIELFPLRTGVAAETLYVYRGAVVGMENIGSNRDVDPDFGTEARKTVDTYVKMMNTQKNGLGIPLPAGRVRVYKRDEADAVPEFVGEDIIDHTPKDEGLRLRVGSAFDVVGDRKQTNFTHEQNSKVAVESFEIKLRNHKNKAIDVIIKEPLYRSIQWEIVKCSEKFEKTDAREIDIPVTVQSDVEKTVTYQVKYSW